MTFATARRREVVHRAMRDEAPIERTPELEARVADACDAHGLDPCYRDCLWPILRAPPSRWPRCCGGGCEPCNETLCAIARQVLATP